MKHPVGHNLSVTVAYTWSHNLDNGGGFKNPYNLHSAYGNSSLNTPQVFTFSGIFTEPWFKSGWHHAILGGWKYSDMTTIQSGSSTTFGITGTNLGGPISRPNIVGQITYPKTWKPYQNGSNAFWFNPGTGAGTATGSIFARPANGYYGTGANGKHTWSRRHCVEHGHSISRSRFTRASHSNSGPSISTCSTTPIPMRQM